MSDWREWLGAAWVLPVAAAVVFALYRKGFLSRRAFRDAPPRSIPIGGWDAVGAVALMMIGVFLAQVVIVDVLSFESDEAGGWATPRQSAASMLITQALFMGLPAMWFVFRAAQGEAGLRRSGVVPRRPVRDAKWGVVTLLAAAPMVMAATLIVSGVALLLGEPTPAIGHSMLEEMRTSASSEALVMMIVAAVVVAPLLEEVVFRGLMQTALLRTLGEHRRWVVILLASIVFAATHVSAAIWQSLAALLVLSVALGYVYERTGSLWPSIVAHAGFNALNITLVLSGIVGQASPEG